MHYYPFNEIYQLHATAHVSYACVITMFLARFQICHFRLCDAFHLILSVFHRLRRNIVQEFQPDMIRLNTKVNKIEICCSLFNQCLKYHLIRIQNLFYSPRNGKCLQVIFLDASITLGKSLHSSKRNILLASVPLVINFPAPTI